MAEPARRIWTVEAFFAWQARQPDLYELVSGEPRLMAGASNVHDDIVVNLVAELKTQTRGSGCRPFTGDGAVETRPGQIRRPDVGLDCGRRDPRATVAAEARLIVEVLSPSTRDFDTFEKLDEYRAMPGLDAILIVEPNQPLVVVWERSDEGSWSSRRVEGLEAGIALPTVGVTLTMAAIYDGVSVPAAPRLVQGEDREERA
ncbi:Uma2 family endonuclease [Methylobacterium oryzihabitans]|uniref:Uma2 family endonuclease n=1 Tax=Methylobacterium oryzihabitans TaxID=2499852 RepID=A0A437NX29_9HYPH|nr:Uma2 family endonuclease [Methylobacterium oryzihabitans]RVU14551.1 Uma2 family endonuclease [Methylobacterium oryzihabitans]